MNVGLLAHIGGLFAGLAVSYWVLNKFKESWGQKKFRDTHIHQHVTESEIACCNNDNCSEAWLNNADCCKLIRDPCAWIFMAALIVVFIACIVYNATVR